MRRELPVFLFIYQLFLVQKGITAQHQPHIEPESVSWWWGDRRSGWAENGARRADMADVGPEPCPKSGPIQPTTMRCRVKVSTLH